MSSGRLSSSALRSPSGEMDGAVERFASGEAGGVGPGQVVRDAALVAERDGRDRWNRLRSGPCMSSSRQ